MPWLLLIMLLGLTAARTDEAAVVARALAGNLLELEDGRMVRLAGIRLPAVAGGQAPDLATRATSALAGLVEGRAVRFSPDDPGRDRHGRLVAQVWRQDGLWLQGALLERGLVQVQTRPGEVALAAEMAAREDHARRAGLGLWAHRRFGAQPAHQVGSLVGSFQIVQGRVVRVAPTERYLYLNFGADWRSDFTLRIARTSARSFRDAGIDLEQLAGHEVEVRGFVLEAGGPLIELSHPEQMQVLP